MKAAQKERSNRKKAKPAVQITIKKMRKPNRFVKCKFCTEKFKRGKMAAMEEHYLSQHEVEAEPCEKCEASYPDLISHHRNKHRGIDICPFCATSWGDKGYVMLHILESHRNVIGLTELDHELPQEQTVDLVSKMRTFYKGDGEVVEKNGFLVVMKNNKVLFTFTVIQPSNLKGKVPERRPSYFREKNYRLTASAIHDLDLDAGHMVPCADFSSNEDAFVDTFSMYNIQPMQPSMNRGQWSSLEQFSRKLPEFASCVSVFSFPIIDKTRKPKRVAGYYKLDIPVAFGKIDYIERPGEETKAQVYVVKNKKRRKLPTFFSSRSSFQEVKKSTGLSFLECPLTFDTRENHMCEKCCKTFSSKERLELHKDDHKLICRLCRRKKPEFNTQEELEAHQLANHTQYKCTYCEYTAFHRKYVQEHEQRFHLETRMFPCSFGCGMDFNMQSTCDRHEKDVHGNVREFECSFEDCNERFKRLDHKQLHHLLHTEEKPFVCDKCDFSTTTQVVLQRHMLRHLGLRPFSCDYCTENMRTKIDKLKHSRRYHIEFYDKTAGKWIPPPDDYVKPASIVKHRRRKMNKDESLSPCESKKQKRKPASKEKLFECITCKFATNTKRSLKRHELVHFGKFPIACEYCTENCRTLDDRKLHYKRHHMKFFDATAGAFVPPPADYIKPPTSVKHKPTRLKLGFKKRSPATTSSDLQLENNSEIQRQSPSLSGTPNIPKNPITRRSLVWTKSQVLG